MAKLPFCFKAKTYETDSSVLVPGTLVNGIKEILGPKYTNRFS